MSRRDSLLATATYTALSLVSACSQSGQVTGGGGTVATIMVSPSPAPVTVSGTTQLTAVLKDASGNLLSGKAVSWSSFDTTTAKVSATGLVTGVALGSATITA